MNFRLFLVALVFSLSGFSQDSAVKSIGTQFSYQSQDFFGGIHLGLQRKSFEHQVQFQVGIRATFFQRRLFPQVAYQFGWLAWNGQNFRLGFIVRPVFSVIHARKDSARGFVFTEDFLPGLKFSAGKRNRISLCAMYGPYLEQRYSDITRQYNSYLSTKFNVEIAYSIVL